MKKGFKKFDIRWNEELGIKECPYLYRWILITPFFSIRIHNFIKSDDKRYKHDHPWWFITLILKGSYTDIGEAKEDKLTIGSIRYRKANHFHTVDVAKGGVWTLLLTGKCSQKWGFKVNNKKMRPLRYFSRHGHPPCES